MRLRGWGTKQVWLTRFEDAKWFYAQIFVCSMAVVRFKGRIAKAGRVVDRQL